MLVSDSVMTDVLSATLAVPPSPMRLPYNVNEIVLEVDATVVSVTIDAVNSPPSQSLGMLTRAYAFSLPADDSPASVDAYTN